MGGAIAMMAVSASHLDLSAVVVDTEFQDCASDWRAGALALIEIADAVSWAAMRCAVAVRFSSTTRMRLCFAACIGTTHSGTAAHG
jgi:hypothetical protein